ncbi:MAG: thiamine-phosphate kinase [Solirubrobacterales bacterium]|nr:thiamine-phosphate kinase [Solirubrobacterales bacterium]
MSETSRIHSLVERFGGSAARIVVPSGDDAAVVIPGGAVAVTSVDSVVENVDFTLADWPLEAVGHKAVAIALSDLAAMGVTPGEIYIAAGVPKSLSEEDFAALADGIEAAATAHGVVVAGGDLSAAGELWLSVTVVGYAASEDAIVRRSGAKPGDVVAVTGDFGRAAQLLGGIPPNGDAFADDPALAKQFAPKPRLAAGAALATNGATAMIDVSDGLARDAGHVAMASGARLEISLESIPLAGTVSDARFAAASGEEYELLATLPQERWESARKAVAETGTTLTAIGRVTEGSGAALLDPEGARVEIRGFDHFD